VIQWILRAPRGVVWRAARSGQWKIPHACVDDVREFMSPGDSVFLAVSGRSHDGEPREGYAGWAWVKTVTRHKPTNLHTLHLESVRLPVDTNGSFHAVYVRPASGRCLRVECDADAIESIKHSLHWRHPDDEHTTSALDGEIGESWGQREGTDRLINWGHSATGAQRSAGSNDFLADDK